jgi:hypothetical protein
MASNGFYAYHEALGNVSGSHEYGTNMRYFEKRFMSEVC